MTVASAAQAGEIVVATDQGSERWWSAFAVELGRETGQPVRLGDQELWLGSPDPRDTADARAVFEEGEQFFLALDLKKAAARFDDAHERYLRILDAFAFDEATYDQVLRSGFYAAWSHLQNRKKRQGREVLHKLLTRFPAAAPDSKIFPPPFLADVEDARRKLERRAGVNELTVTVRPAAALVSLDGSVSSSPDGVHRLSVGEGSHRLGVGIPGLAASWRDISGGDAQQIEVDLTDWPSSTPRPLPGGPAGPKVVNAYRAGHGVSHFVWITSGERLRQRDSVVWVHDVGTGEVTGVLMMPRGAGADDGRIGAAAVARAMSTDEMEVLVIDDGRARPDGDLETRVEAVLSDAAVSTDVTLEPVVPAAPSGPSSIRLGAALATGFGVATEVTDPGLAPTPLVARLNLSWRATPTVDLGIGGRFQVVNPAALGEVFARFRFPWIYLRTGVGVGRITHKILDTENRKESSSELAGPVVGLEIPLGPVELGFHVHAPLFPDATVHADLSLGMGLDF
jgi:hypothetical protein